MRLLPKLTVIVVVEVREWILWVVDDQRAPKTIAVLRV
jgi:hypothetical protein